MVDNTPTILETYEQTRSHNFINMLCSGTTTLTVTEYVFCRSRTKSSSFIPVECVTASAAQRMLEMTFCVVYRMVGGEEVREIGFIEPISLNKTSHSATAPALHVALTI